MGGFAPEDEARYQANRLKTDEQLEVERSRPTSGRKAAQAAEAELQGREAARRTAERMRQQAQPPAPEATPSTSGFQFKKGGRVRGDGLAQRGRTKGRMR